MKLRIRKILNTFGLIALAAVILGPFPLYLWAGFRYGLSSDSADWGDFGSYYGGIVGPLLTFATLMFLAVQYRSLRIDRAQEELWKSIDQAKARVDAALDRSLGSHGHTLRNYVFGYRDYAENEGMTTKVEREFLSHLVHYASTIDGYRRSFGQSFLLRPHQEDIRRYFDWLMTHQDGLTDTDIGTLGFVGHHLGLKLSLHRSETGQFVASFDASQ